MSEQEIRKRCEICLFFEPEDKFKHIQKNLKAKNPNRATSYDLVEGLLGYSQNTSSDIGACSKHDGKSVNETDLCDDFLHDISKNY